ncbi:GerMN domain-containing protein [Blastococcus sp. SYSU DS0753]
MRALAVLLSVLVALLTGCGVGSQPRPERVAVPAATAGSPALPTDDAGPEVVVYFVHGAELAPVPRAAQAATPGSILALLAAGPTRAEVIGGLRTALAPQSIAVDEGLPGGMTSVSVTEEFARITGGNQLLAVAQVVWTLTELPGTGQVRFLLDGRPVEVPTDGGLSDGPVGRDQYRSVAPSGSPGPSTPATPGED